MPNPMGANSFRESLQLVLGFFSLFLLFYHENIIFPFRTCASNYLDDSSAIILPTRFLLLPSSKRRACRAPCEWLAYPSDGK